MNKIETWQDRLIKSSDLPQALRQNDNKSKISNRSKERSDRTVTTLCAGTGEKGRLGW